MAITDPVDQPMRAHLKRWAYLQLICLSPFLFFFLLRNFDLFHLIELKTLDTRLRLIVPKQVKPQLRLITIDDQSQSEKGIGPLPWEAYVYDSLVSLLHEATAVGLIMRFNREWEAEGEYDLFPAENLFVIQTYISQNLSTNRLPAVQEWTQLPSAFSRLASTVSSSFSRFHSGSADGIYRSAQLVITEKKSPLYHYSLEIKMLCRMLGLTPEQIALKRSFWSGYFLEFSSPQPDKHNRVIKIPIDQRGRCFFPYLGNHHRYPSDSFIEVLQASDLPSFDNKIVLVGVTSTNQPKAQTAVGTLSALGLRANLVNALLFQRYVWHPTPIATAVYFLFLALVLLAIAGIAYHRNQQHLFLLGTLGLLGGHLVVSFLIFVAFKIWINITATSLAILSTGLMTGFLLDHLRLHTTLAQLQTTQKQLIRSEKEAAFGIMAARVRHELRNVLNLVRAPVEMVRNNFRKGDPLNLQKEPNLIIAEMESAINAIAKLDQMIDRDLSFFQDRQLNLKRGSIESVIKAAVESIRPLSLANGVEIEQKLLNANPNLPAIAIDEDQMKLAFINLIRNACQAMPTGGTITILVFIEACHTNRSLVQSFTQVDVDRLVISIKDTGIGIPAEEQSQIFDAFYTTKPKGLGLGLLNVKNVIEAHGGQIVVDSQTGRGTKFTIRLPLAQPL